MSERELDKIANEILAQDVRSEMCRICGDRGVIGGTKTKLVILDANGNDTGIRAISELYYCSNGHHWWDGEGKPRGIRGDDPILFEDHLYYRRNVKETYTESGTPDPSINSGFYHREHINRGGKDSRAREDLRKSNLL